MVTIGNDRLRSLAEGWAHTAATLVSDCSLAGSQYSANCTDTAVAMEELVRLRAENEQLQSELTALRRPVEQSDEVDAIRERAAGREPDMHFAWQVNPSYLEAQCDCNKLLSMLDAAQREKRALGQANQNLANRCATLQEEINCAGVTTDRLQAEIARLSSPPPERADIAERQTAYREQLIASDSLSSVSAEAAVRDIDTLLQDLARARNSREVLKVERDASREASVKLMADNAEYCNRHLAQLQRIERLQGALRATTKALSYTGLVLSLNDQALVDSALAASQHTAGSPLIPAPEQSLIETARRSPRIVDPGELRQHTAGSGDGVAGD